MIRKKDGKVTIIGDGGKEYSGTYHFDEGLLKVYYKKEDEKVHQHPASDPEPMARIMLANIIRKVLEK